MSKKPSDKLSEFPEARDWFNSKHPVTQDQWLAMETAARARAFYVAGVTNADVTQSVLDAITRAVSAGTTLEDFKKEVAAKLSNEWNGSVSNEAWRIETIFRNNVAAAYSAGRIQQLREPFTAKIRPYWLFDAILDARTSKYCKPFAGTLLPNDDPWWDGHIPPLHHCCRSGIRALTKEQAETRGITEDPPKETAQKGWGGDPLVAWKPDLSKYDPGLKPQVAKDIAKPPKATNVKITAPEAKTTAPVSKPEPKVPEVKVPVSKPKAPAPEPKVTAPEAKVEPKPVHVPKGPEVKAQPEPVKEREFEGPKTTAEAMAEAPVTTQDAFIKRNRKTLAEVPDGYADELEAKISKDQAFALKVYSGSRYREIRAAGYRPDSEYYKYVHSEYTQEQRDIDHFIKIKETLAKSPKIVGALLRGTQITAKELDAVLSSGEFEFGGPTSASVSSDAAKQFHTPTSEDQSFVGVYFHIKDQQSGVSIESISMIRDEREVMLPGGTKFGITKVYTIQTSPNKPVSVVIECHQINTARELVQLSW